MEPLRLCIREGQPGVGDQYRRRRHCWVCVLRPCGPPPTTGARLAEGPYGADPAHVDPPAGPIPDTPLGLGPPSPRRRRPADSRSRHPDPPRPRLGPWLANTPLRTILASSQRVNGLTPTGQRALSATRQHAVLPKPSAPGRSVGRLPSGASSPTDPCSIGPCSGSVG